MSLLIGFLTFILVLTSVLLILLVLIQLPKKEAGAGLAFGGGAVDTLIGAGSGNALTKLTKYSAAILYGRSAPARPLPRPRLRKCMLSFAKS